MKSKNIPALTGLRFFAAMAIVLWHSQTGYFFKYGAFAPFYLAGAVPVFFVLSGFVLTISLGKYKSWSDFFVARIARIWPTHIAALIFMFLLFYPYSMDLLHHADTVRRLVLNALLLQAWSPNPATYWSYNAPSWSVSCEMFFYAVFPLAFAFLTRHTLARVVAIAIALFGAIVAIDTIHPGIDVNWLAGVNPVSCFAAFAIGIATGIWFRRAPSQRSGGTTIQTVSLALALAANALFSSHPIPATPAATSFVITFGPAPFYAVLILVLARYDGAVSRVLSLRPIVYGGEISYAIYLFHQLFIRWHSSYRAEFNGIPIWWQYACIIVATFAIAIAAHHLIERPAQKAILAAWRMFRQPRVPQIIVADTADAAD
jgi:peptidoglycan/LPS O-acetylase OafA/YrhL